MNTVKASISVGEASIQLEGPQEFVEKYLDRYYSVIEKSRISHTTRGEVTKPVETKEKEALRKRPRVKRPLGGPSCTDRIRALKEEDYFAQARTSGDVLVYLRDQKGTPYKDNIITANLKNMFNRGELRRFREGKKYKYVNP